MYCIIRKGLRSMDRVERYSRIVEEKQSLGKESFPVLDLFQ